MFEVEGREDLAQVAAEVVAAVERLLRDGRNDRVEVHVSSRMGRVVVTQPDELPIQVRLDKAA
jgi:hypothetical protein